MAVKHKLSTCLLAALLTTIPLLAVPQEDVNVAMVLWRGETEAESGFRARLDEDRRYTFTYSVFDAAQDKGRLEDIVANLKGKDFRLIYSFGTTVTKRLKKATAETPIVFNIVARPVKAGIIESWENSGSNVTGASNAVPMATVFHTLSKVMNIGRLAFLYNPKEANSRIQRDEVAALSDDFGYELVDAPIHDADQIPSVVRDLEKAEADAVLLPSDSLVKARADEIIPLLNENGLPSIVSIPAMVRDNQAFIGLGPDYFLLGRTAGEKALDVLAGTAPNDVPSSTLERMHITVNLTTAKKLGISVPVQILRIATVVR